MSGAGGRRFKVKHPRLGRSRFGFQAVRAAILTRLWAMTPCPTQILAPSVPSMRLRSSPYPCLRVLIRPSQPVRHLMGPPKRQALLYGLSGPAGLTFPRNHDLSNPEVRQVIFDALLP